MQATGAALVVHDLKNALGALEAGLEALSLRPDRARAVAAHRQCRQLRQRLVSYLTVYGHDGRLRAHLEDESPLEVLQSLAARHADAPCIVSVVLPHEAPPVWHFDRHLVMLALESAMHNALRFARHEVQLMATVDDTHLVLSVLDDGPGPQPSSVGTPGDADNATGLGLSLCRAVAQAHGTQREDGGVRLAARPDGGACFELWLAT
jgi:signal transduction histidine kinase